MLNLRLPGTGEALPEREGCFLLTICRIHLVHGRWSLWTASISHKAVLHLGMLGLVWLRGSVGLRPLRATPTKRGLIAA